jgi:hypothetical protein
METIDFDSFSVTVPDTWGEMLDEEDGPYTLVKEDGVGALQFSIASWTDGDDAAPTIEALREMLLDFGESYSLGTATTVHEEREPLLSVFADFLEGGDFIRAWFVSDGSNFAKVTYVCNADEATLEVDEAVEIVRSMRFTNRGTGASGPRE